MVSFVNIGPRGSSTQLNSRGSIVSFSPGGVAAGNRGGDVIGDDNSEVTDALDRLRNFVRGQLTTIKQIAIANGTSNPLPLKVTALFIAGYGALKLAARGVGVEDTFNAYVGDPFNNSGEVPQISREDWEDLVNREAALLSMAGTVIVVPVWRRDPTV
jgi:hypothetical protein